MQILVVHNRYRSAIPSGENAVVDNEIADLRAAGHEVVAYLRSSDEIAEMSLVGRLSHAASPIHSRTAVHDLESIVRRTRPDVLHLHNPFPLVSPSVVPAVHRLGVACVQTVHNHRHTCMKGTYQRDGRLCRDCLIAGHPGPGVRYGCYRSSRPESAVMALALLRARRAYRDMDRFIALTPAIADSLRDAGIEDSRISLRPNSVPDPGQPAPSGSGFTFVGRLSAEKGVLALADAWHSLPVGELGTLRIAGDGPDRERLEQLLAGRPDVELLGPLDRTGVHRAMSHAAVVVVPSMSPEGLPLVVLEAMAAGRALLVSDQSALSGIVDPAIGRVVSASSSALADGMVAMAADAGGTARMGEAARARYEMSYHPATALQRLEEIYELAISGRAAA